MNAQGPWRGGAAPKDEVHHGLGAAVADLGKAFEPGELAYLAATSKPELPIRDRVAWHLSRSLGDAYVVSREWRRADIAVLKGSDVLAQLEAKAMYSFDVMQPGGRSAYLRQLASDAVKMSALARSDRYLLSTVTHVQGEIREDVRRYVVKYSPMIARAAATHGSDAVQALGCQRWFEDLENNFGRSTIVTHVDGGQVWDLSVSVDVFLTGPLVSHAHVQPGVRER